ncbi:MAG: Bug family tripartite tricarboxylate transporter substrate binding protein [Betaproteobacteria bacterium]
MNGNFARRRSTAAALAALAASALLPAQVRAATDWPARPPRLIVPFPPGGGADILARTIVPYLEKALGAQIVVENKPGAGGNVGAEYVARAAPDGYTLLYGTNGTQGINPALYRELRFDPASDLMPVSQMTEIATLLIVNNDLSVATAEELIRYARANPGKLNFASAGSGTTSHLAGEMFKRAIGADIVHVPYRGGALAVTDLIAGRVQMMIDVMPNAYPLAKDGRARGLAVGTARRVPGASDFPTLAEAGLRNFEASAWDGIFVPAGTPAPIVARLAAAVRTALSDPELVAALRARGATAAPSASPEDFARFVAASAERWASAVRASGARVD